MTWPALPYEAWRETKDTLHMCLQVIGKVRLALTARQPQWANVPLHLTARGLTTTPMWGGQAVLEVVVDLIDHEVRIETVHATYDPAWANRFWSIISRVALVMEEHRARFRGKTSDVHFFWGSFDLANTRYSGRPAHPGPNADLIMRLSHDAEQICAGFWPGDQAFRQPAFFAYTFPQPAGIEAVSVRPSGATWNSEIDEFILPYETMRLAGDPRRALLDFLESTYDAGATRLSWSPDLVTSR